MTEKKIELPICSALIPVFYQNFQCLTQDCKDCCCAEDWLISFDKKDYLRLRRLDAPPALREQLERLIRRKKKGKHDGKFYGQFDLESNHMRCPFLDEDGLCTFQLACGHDALPWVCKTYPRNSFYTAAAKEYSLSPACEGVLQLLWDLPGGVEFLEDPLPQAEQMSMVIPRDENLLLYFAPVREAFIDILQNRAMSLTERMLCLGVMIQRLQKEDWEDFDLDSWGKQTSLLTGSDAVREMDIPGNRDIYILQNLHVLNAIAAQKRSWPAEIYKALEVEWNRVSGAGEDDPADEKVRCNFSPNAYAKALAQFKAAFSDYEYFFENLMVAAALLIGFPKLDSKSELWKSYISLCNLYSLYRFVSVSGCKGEATKERLFHMIVMASRATLHNQIQFKEFQQHLLRHGSSSLAHMAILLRWD